MADESNEQKLKNEYEQLMVEFDELHQRLGAIERRHFHRMIERSSVDERIAIDAAHKIYKEDWRAWKQRLDAWQQVWENRNQ